jgi:serine/threonine-protein kinase
MASVFISYRRKPSAILAQLLVRDLKQRDINVYLDTDRMDTAGTFPARLLNAIEEHDVFVCLVGEGTFESEWVQREVEHAHKLGKPMIPVFQESWKNEPAPTAHIRALLEFDGVYVFDEKNVYVAAAIESLSRMVENTAAWHKQQAEQGPPREATSPPITLSIDNLTGQMLGQFEIRELLGMGGMGAVYRANQPSLRREVALKVLPPSLAQQREFIERFTREAQTAAALQHAHIVPIYDFGTHSGLSYVVMRLLTGGSLAERLSHRLAGGGGLPSLPETAEVLKALGAALDYAHSRGVIHRDIKTNNVMFDDQGSPFLVDFGIAKITTATTGLTGTGMTVGTPSYMAPEQWKGESVTPATDQYALGVMTYHMITGRLPFEATTPYALMHKHLNEEPTPPEVWRANLPEGVKAVVAQAMAKNPRDRFPSVREFAAAFESAIADLESPPTGFFTTPLPVKPAPPAQKTPTRQPSGIYDGHTVTPASGLDHLPTVTPVSQVVQKVPTTPQPVQPPRRSGLNLPVLLAVAAAVIIVGLIGLSIISNNQQQAAATATQDALNIAMAASETALALTPTATDTPSQTPTSTFTLTPSPQPFSLALDNLHVENNQLVFSITSRKLGEGEIHQYQVEIFDQETKTYIREPYGNFTLTTDKVDDVRIPLGGISVQQVLVSILALDADGVPLASTSGQVTVPPTPTLAPTDTATSTPTDTYTPTDTPTRMPTPTPATPIAVARRSMPVRLGPGQSYPVTTTLNRGDRLDIVGISEDGLWYQIVLADGSLGWVSTSTTLVDAFGDVDGVPVALAPSDTPTWTPTPTSTLTPTATPTPTATFTPSPTPTDTGTATHTSTPTSPSTRTPTAIPASPTPASCPGALPSFLAPGIEGFVRSEDPRPLNVRLGPGRTADEIDEMQSGERFIVLEGPVCSESLAWFRISYRGGIREGWIAEGDDRYFASPVTLSGATQIVLVTQQPDRSRDLAPNCPVALKEDEFLNGLSPNDWFTDYTTGARSNERLIDGFYELRLNVVPANSDEGVTWGSLRGFNFRSARVEAVISVTSFSDATVRTGIWLRYQDENSFLAFMIRNNGSYYVGRWENGQYTDLVRWTSVRAIRTGDHAVNTLRVDIEGDTFSFFINGTPLTTITDSTWSDGRFAFFGASRVAPVSFLLDYLRICSL